MAGPIVVRVDANGKPLDPVPAGYTFGGFYRNPPQAGPSREQQQLAQYGLLPGMPNYANPERAFGYQQQQQQQEWAQQPEWNWKSPPVDQSGRPVGPDGAPLPQDAESFDPFGRPYYGPGITGWIRGAWARIFDPTVARSPLPEDWNKLITPGTTYQQFMGLTSEQRMGYIASQAISRASQAFSLAEQKAEKLSALGGEKPSLFTYMGRVVKESVTGLLSGLQLASEVAEPAIYGTYRGMEDIAKTSGIAPLPYIFGDPNTSALGDIFDLNKGLLGIPYTLYRAVRSPLSWDEKKAILEENWQAGRIAYSMFGNAALRQEFIRQYREGANPEFLAMQMQNPLAEMVGTMVIDPTWMVGLATKGLKEGSFLKQADYALKAVDPNVAKALEGMGDIADEGRAVEAIGKLAEADKAAVAVAKSPIDELAKLDAAGMKQAMADMERLGTPGRTIPGWARLTAQGKRWTLSSQAGVLASWVASNYGLDEAVDVFTAMARSASLDADEAMQGLGYLASLKHPTPFFSQAGYQLRIMLHGLLEGEGGSIDAEKLIKSVEGFQGDPGGLATFMGKQLDNIVKGMIPDVNSGLAALEKVKAGTATAKDAALARWYRDLSPVTKSLNGFNNTLQKFVGPVNRFYAGLYMGMSPGYALRNAFNNTFTIFADQGLAAAGRVGITELKELFSPGSSAARSEGIIRNWLGGVLTPGSQVAFAGAASAAEGVGNKGLWGIFSGRASAMELGAAKNIVANSVERTMRSALKPGRALPAIEDLLNKGVPREAAEMLVNMVIDNYGDVAKAGAEFAEKAATGHYDTIRYLTKWLPKDDVTALYRFGIFNPLRNAVVAAKDAGSMEQGVAGLDSIRQAFMEFANRVARETPAVVPDKMEEMLGTLYDLDKLVSQGHLTNEASDLFQRTMVTNSAVFRAYEDALNAVAHTMGLAQANPELAKAAIEHMRRTQVILDMGREANDAFKIKIQYWSDKIKAAVVRGGGKSYNKMAAELGLPKIFYKDAKTFYKALWETVGMKGDEAFMASKLWESPEVVAKKMGLPQAFLNHMWDGFWRPTRVEEWSKVRSAYVDAMEEFFTQAEKKAKLPLDKIPDLARARAANETAGILDGAEHLKNGLVVPKIPLRAPVVVPYLPGTPPSLSRVLFEQRDELGKLFDRVEGAMKAGWNDTRPVPLPEAWQRAVSGYLKEAGGRIATARLTAATVADAEREFALLNYNKKTYWDLALGYLMPYHFWYNRTYGNWLKRVVYDPVIVAQYAKYRSTLEKIHAKQPEWWRYQINTNELLGVDWDSPLYFNLEATINPLNGLTGVDFNDPYKRVDWWSRTLDDMNKFGPTVWTPVQIAMAVALNAKGEQDAAARWAGRFIPQTATLKSITALLGIGGAGGLEADPFVRMFSGGFDPYERNRIGRALGTMIQNEQVSQAQGLEAGWSGQGPIWDEAAQAAAVARAPGQLASFFMGVGFRPRSEQEIETDRMYTDLRQLGAQEGNLSPDEYKSAMEQLRTKYPFMDTVLLSRKGGVGRDRQYAYNVLARIPPGSKTDVAKAAGIDPKLFAQFYETKGHLELWDKTERDKFLAAIADMGALLELPDSATRAEWQAATGAYSRMEKEMQARFGDDIQNRIDVYLSAKGNTWEDRQKAEAVLSADPGIGQALDYRTEAILSDPVLSRYYGGIDKVRGFYQGQKWDAIYSQVGSDVGEKWAQYWQLKDAGDKAGARAYWKAHPELGRYMELKQGWDVIIAENVARLGLKLDDGMPPVFRNDATVGNMTQQQVYNALQPAPLPNLSWNEWQMLLPDALTKILGTDQPLPAEAQAEIDYYAQQMGIDPQTMYQMILSAWHNK